MFRTIGDRPSSWESRLPAELLRLPEELGRLHSDTEITLFRALQEALTNVHRHSASSRADIRVALDPNQVRLEIQDYGHGMPHGTLQQLNEGAGKTGVGIAGMRERVRELGGYMTIKSDPRGTLLTVVLPLAEALDLPFIQQPSEKRISAA